MNEELKKDQDELIEDTLDLLEDIADELAVEMSWEEAHAMALRNFLTELKEAYEEEFGEQGLEDIEEDDLEEEISGNA